MDFITAKNSVLVLVDYQKAMIDGVKSGEHESILNAATAVAKAAKILDIPVVLTSISPAMNGVFLKKITDFFPKQKAIARKIPGFDAFEDKDVLQAVKVTGRRKIIVSGLWTSMCFAYTALHGVRDGFDVYGLMDAGGDASKHAHKYGIIRMIQAGVVPMTWMPLVSEWMHDWANPKSSELIKEVYGTYNK